MEFKRISNHEIHIRHTVNGGIIAKVGCAELCFSSPEDMMVAMGQFYADPDGMEKEYNRSSATPEVAYGEDCAPDSRAIVHGANATGQTLRRGPRNVEAEEAPDRALDEMR